MATVLLTCDFDAASPWILDRDSPEWDMTQASWGEYGSRRGILRIMDVLDRLQLPATFFVPGWTADNHPEKVRTIYRAGHEIAHHGYNHVPPVRQDPQVQRDEVIRGVDAIASCVGSKPVGYRSPSWQLTPVILDVLMDLEFAYDSSCMGDDYPYVETYGETSIVELPVQWQLDDFPYLGWLSHHAGALKHPAEMFQVWREEVDVAIREERSIVLTFHAELVGRASPVVHLESFLRELIDKEVTFARCSDFVADEGEGIRK